MRIVLLTTESLHHAYFLRELSQFFPVYMTLVETNTAKAGFTTHHQFEEKRDIYEANTWFNGRRAVLSEFCKTAEFDNINDQGALALVRSLKPDVILTFGTGLIKTPLIDICPNGFVNLHGGDPEYYRGLDTNLWTIYHKDFSKLTTTLHLLNPILDDGEIIQRAQIHLKHSSEIHELRAMNTKLCVELSVSALADFKRFGHFISHPQRKIGRYYSFMPTVLKDVCCQNFERYVKCL